MIFHRLVLKELLWNFIVIIFSMSVILFMEKFVRLTRLFMGKGADFADIVKLFFYIQPSLLLFFQEGQLFQTALCDLRHCAL